MAATYNPLLPTDRDRVRFEIGDTEGLPAGALYSDEAIDAELAAKGNLSDAIVSLARGLVMRFGQLPDSVNVPGEISVSWRYRIDAWNAAIASWGGGSVSAGGSGGFTSIAPSRGVEIRAEYVPNLFTD